MVINIERFGGINFVIAMIWQAQTRESVVSVESVVYILPVMTATGSFNVKSLFKNNYEKTSSRIATFL